MNGTSFLERDCNKHCSDCQIGESAWAAYSKDYATFICIHCAGVHRSLGTHVSKVKSITLDVWTEEEIEHFKQQGDNELVNERFEKKRDDSTWSKPSQSDDRNYRKEFITAKYVHRYWHESSDSEEQVLPQLKTPPKKASTPSPAKSRKIRNLFTSRAETDEAPPMFRNRDRGLSPRQSTGNVEFTGILTVHLICGTNLISKDLSGYSDPYVVIASAPAQDPKNPYPGQSVKSRTFKKTLNPQFDEKLTVCLTDLEKDVLCVTVFDLDRLSKDDPMGDCHIYIRDHAAQLKTGEEVFVESNLQNAKRGALQLVLSFNSLK